MTGFWVGEYTYDWPGEPIVPFLANIEDTESSLSGSINEPNTAGFTSDRLDAFLQGRRSGLHVDFAKVYDGASDLAHRVDYVGTLSANGLSLTGTWSLADDFGTFRMTREAVDDIAEEIEAERVDVTALAPTRAKLLE